MSFQRKLRRIFVATTMIGSITLAPQMSSAEGLLDFLFGGSRKQEYTPPPISRPIVSGLGFCVRSCDGKYFPLMRGAASSVQICKALCPASPTEVFYGSRIEDAYARSGERYTDSKNAFAYRNALRADCTCNGRSPAGLAPLDLAQDDSLRSGDMLATKDGLVAYSGARVGVFSSLTTPVRGRLNDMNVAPRPADIAANNAATSTAVRTLHPAAIAMKPVPGVANAER